MYVCACVYVCVCVHVCLCVCMCLNSNYADDKFTIQEWQIPEYYSKEVHIYTQYTKY